MGTLRGFEWNRFACSESKIFVVEFVASRFRRGIFGCGDRKRKVLLSSRIIFYNESVAK